MHDLLEEMNTHQRIQATVTQTLDGGGWRDPRVGAAILAVLAGSVSLGGLILLTWDFTSSLDLHSWNIIAGLMLVVLAGFLLGVVAQQSAR